MGYFENNIYIQTPHCGVRNRAINNVNTSSDFCVFTYPEFTMSGASKVPCDADLSATTSATTYLYEITTATTHDLTFQFTANTSEFTDKNTSFKYEIFKYNTDLGYFANPPIYQSSEIEWSSFSGTSAFTNSIPLKSLRLDGDYLVKGYFIHDVCTEFASRLGITNDTSSYKSGDYLGLYEPSLDFYMVLFKGAETPFFEGNLTGSIFKALKQKPIIPSDGQTTFILPSDVSVDFVITLNGLALSKDLDYVVSQYSGGTQPYVIELSAATKSTDIMSFIYASTGSGGLKSESFDISSIPSGPTDSEGSNYIYYNTTTSKYELFLSQTPTSGNNVLIMINGVILAYNIDYYQSISNPKRIIFEGTILVGDIITAVYNVSTEFVDSINTSNPNIAWRIITPPTEINGQFILEFASDEAMTSQISSASTAYVVGQNAYNLDTTISGAVGTELYYRVTNIKEYETLCGDIFSSVAYSEVIPITIATNSINSY